jgi:3-deoxy-D-manno-octulosonic-acid transferase
VAAAAADGAQAARAAAPAEPGYAVQHTGERFGRYEGAAPAPGSIWVHAVSLGETRAAAVLIAALRETRPGCRILLTHGTATGRAEGVALLREGDAQAWLPWDMPQAVEAFLQHFRPALGVLMETEVWPALVAACRAHGVPLVLANARLNQRSFVKTLRLDWARAPRPTGRWRRRGRRPKAMRPDFGRWVHPCKASLAT